ncbi:MAG: aminotransferase class IV [Campylobacterota bacterium]|nr:aminotransferase class IV [Campylobacterota bacterium]
MIDKNMLFFETIKCYEDEIFHLDYHKKRVARTIGKNIDLNEYIYPPSIEFLRCKVIYNIDDIVDIKYYPYKQKDIKSFKIVYDENIKYKYKAINRDIIDNLYSLKDKADDIIIFKNGYMTDTSIANIAIFLDSIWLTPKIPLLNGTTRDRLLEEGFIKESNITLEQLLKAEKIALMNAMIDFTIIEDFKIYK